MALIYSVNIVVTHLYLICTTQPIIKHKIIGMSSLHTCCILDTILLHYRDVIMGAMTSQITSLTSLLNRFLWRRLKKTSKLRVTGLYVGRSPLTGEFPAQRTSNAENVSIWWRHHVLFIWKYPHLCVATTLISLSSWLNHKHVISSLIHGHKDNFILGFVTSTKVVCQIVAKLLRSWCCNANVLSVIACRRRLHINGNANTMRISMQM